MRPHEKCALISILMADQVNGWIKVGAGFGLSLLIGKAYSKSSSPFSMRQYQPTSK
jgi:hypothetical protein